MSYISTRDLSVALGFTKTALSRWPAYQQPPRVSARSNLHRYEDVNAWLSELRMFGFAQPPKIEDIVSGQLKLVRRSEAGRQLLAGLSATYNSTYYTWTRMCTGRLPAIMVRPDSWVVSQQAVDFLLSERERAKGDFTYEQVSLFFGIRLLDMALYANEFEIRRDPARKNYKLVSRESVIARLSVLLPETWCLDSEDWIEDRLYSGQPLLSTQEAGRLLGLVRSDVRPLLERGEIAYIPLSLSRTTNWRVAPESVAIYIERMEQLEPLSLDQLAAIFGTDVQTIDAWRAKRSLFCPIHFFNEERKFYRWCITAYIRRWGGFPEVDAERWVRAALKEKRRVVWIENEALRETGLTYEQLLGAVEQGRIPAILAPDQGLVCEKAATLREVQRLA